MSLRGPPAAASSCRMAEEHTLIERTLMVAVGSPLRSFV